MIRGFRFVLLSAVSCLLAPVAAFAGAVGAPEIDPASAAGGLALVISSAALILERRRRR